VLLRRAASLGDVLADRGRVGVVDGVEADYVAWAAAVSARKRFGWMRVWVFRGTGE